MAAQTAAPAHAAVTDRQGRLTLSMIDDRTVVTTSSTTSTALTAVSRLSTADASNDTKVTQVVEIGTNGIVGGVAELGEFSGKLSASDVNSKLLGLMTGKKFGAAYATTTNAVSATGAATVTLSTPLPATIVVGSSLTIDTSTNAETVVVTALTSNSFTATFTKTHTTGVGVFIPGAQAWTYYDLANANFDYVRLIADPLGNIYASWVAMDAHLTDASYSTKTSGMATEDYSTQGPQLVYMNAFPISKVYAVQSSDVTAGNIAIGTTYGSNEGPIPVLPPASGQPPNSLYQSGRCSFLKIVRVPVATSSIGGSTYAAGTAVRYTENQPYIVTASGFSAAGAQTAIATNILLGNGTQQAYLGSELAVGASIMVDIGGANQENCTITAVTTTTISFTTTKTHATTGIAIALAPTTGNVVYNPLSNKLVFGDTLATGDVIRVLFGSYASNSTPTSIGVTPFDSASFPGIPGRLTPVSIAAYQIPRCSQSSIKIGISRKHVNGVGENQIVYGTAGVPDISYSVDVTATDNELIMALQTGSTTAGAGGDVYSQDYTTRYMLANANPLTVNIKSPNANNFTVKSYTGAHPTFTQIAESGNADGELTYKVSGKDYSGNITIQAFA